MLTRKLTPMAKLRASKVAVIKCTPLLAKVLREDKIREAYGSLQRSLIVRALRLRLENGGHLTKPDVNIQHERLSSSNSRQSSLQLLHWQKCWQSRGDC